MGGVFLLLSKISFYGTTLILVILILVLSFKFNKKTENKEDNEVSNEYIASYFDGEYQTEIPGKEDGYVVDKIVCDNGATATWDNEEWGIDVRNATQKIKCSIYFLKYYDFVYTGTEQVFTVLKSGKYKIETWGAQGGNSSDNYIGGYGGYSVGFLELSSNSVLYLNVGGKGENFSTTSVSNGGYNGGGTGGIVNNNYEYKQGGSGGGGATHIATKSGILSSLDNFKNDILIVSGGGGGVGQTFDSGDSGSGGGYVGSNGGYNSSWIFYGTGGTQTSGGYDSYNKTNAALFGKGSDFTLNEFGGNGGGGGYYGGGGSNRGHSCGGGGSGYIGNSLLTNKVMYCYNCEESNEENTKTISTTCVEETPTENCAKKGNGYARITYVG